MAGICGLTTSKGTMVMAIGPGQMSGDEPALRDVSAAVASGNLRLASEMANAAFISGLVHPVLFNARALWLQEQGNHEQALADFQRARELAPPDPILLNAIGLCLLKLNRFKEAVAAFDAAIVINPRLAQAHYRKGWAHAQSGDHDAAQRAHERAVAVQPDFPEALASLASIAARKHDIGAARDYAQRALALDPGQPTALVALALADNADKDFTSAEQRLRTVLSHPNLSPPIRAAVLGLLGDALDGQGRFAEAFAAYTKENDEFRRIYAAQFAGPASAAEAARQLIAYFEKAPAERWKASDDGAPPQDAPAQHVFLLGFMRSGTTLLEQVLASHARVVTLEEKEFLGDAAQLYLTSEDGLNRLAESRGEELAGVRNTYWQRVREHGLAVQDKVFVDKQPLHTAKLPLIAKCFPKAKILFAVRDPRDVVLSCLRRHFEINATMFEFLTLEGSARFYSSIMRLAELYREKLPLDLLQHRYEDMIEDFEARVRAVCDFVGIEWADSMRDFNRNAPSLDLRSPSAMQVQRPLYGEGVGQWRRYAKEIAPILPILQPWVEKFGYPFE